MPRALIRMLRRRPTFAAFRRPRCIAPRLLELRLHPHLADADCAPWDARLQWANGKRAAAAPKAAAAARQAGACPEAGKGQPLRRRIAQRDPAHEGRPARARRRACRQEQPARLLKSPRAPRAPTSRTPTPPRAEPPRAGRFPPAPEWRASCCRRLRSSTDKADGCEQSRGIRARSVARCATPAPRICACRNVDRGREEFFLRASGGRPTEPQQCFRQMRIWVRSYSGGR